MKTIKLILLAILMPVVALSQSVVVDGVAYQISMDPHLNKLTAHVVASWGFDGLDYEVLEDVVIPEKVEYQGTFYTVTDVSSSAFAPATNLTSIFLPATLVKISNNAFQGCSKLQSVNLPNSLEEIGEYAFSGCSSLTSIDIPAGIKEIQSATFNICSKLESVTLHEGLTTIGEYAFAGCTKLESIILPESLKEIGNLAFRACQSLAEVDIPAGVINIGENPFSRCFSLTRLAVSPDNSVYSSPDDKYIVEIDNNRLVSVNNNVLIPDGIPTIGAYAFSGRTDLESIVIPSSVTRIEDSAFEFCNKLKSIKILGTINSLGFEVFTGTPWYWNQNDNDLIYLDDILVGYKGYPTEANIKNGTRLVAERCFDGSNVTYISFPSSVKAIGDYIFSRYGCYSIETMYFGSKEPIEINEKAFYCGNYMDVYVPNGYSGAYSGAPNWCDFYKGFSEYGNEEIAIGSNGIRTFCSENSLDFANSDVRAYVVSEYDTNTSEVTLRRVYDVPERTGVVLVADPGTYQVPSYPRPSDGTNMLVGVTNDTYLNKVYDGYTNYILANKNGNIGFYPVKDGTTLAAGKAYLRLPVGSQPSLARMRFADDDNEATGIVTRMTAPIGDGHIYNLSGQRLREPVKGLNIVNGKKVMVK